jgi:hypothetical protein
MQFRKPIVTQFPKSFPERFAHPRGELPGQAPTVLDHCRSIPAHTTCNLQQELAEGLGTQYGDYNSCLRAIFPSDRRFQVRRL